MGTRMLQRRGTAAEWAESNVILGDGEIGFERDTGEIKFGDGLTAWNDLPYHFASIQYVIDNYETITDALATYLSAADAAATYETLADAAATYETKAHAAATFETLTAAALEETLAHAAATYETLAHAVATYETIAHAAATYADKTSAVQQLFAGAGGVRANGGLYDGANRVYSAGNPGLPVFHGAKAYNSANISVPSGGAILTLNSESIDTDGFHSTSANTSRLTIPAGLAGKYRVNALVEFLGSASGVRYAALYVNGVAAAYGNSLPGVATNTACTVEAILNLAVNDYVELFASQNTGAALNVQFQGAGVDSRLELAFIGT
jgi:hypothetical protein